MPQATLRPKGQLTIPSEILKQWNLQPYDQLEISYHNGVVTLVPLKRKTPQARRKLNQFVGIGKDCWGSNKTDIQATILALRESWTR